MVILGYQFVISQHPAILYLRFRLAKFTDYVFNVITIDNEKDTEHRYGGDDYSFIHLVGHKKLGIKSMVSGLDFNRDGFPFEIPVYLIQGEMDILTSKEVTASYFEKIKASKKEYILLPDAGHGLNQSVVDKQYRILKNNLQKLYFLCYRSCSRWLFFLT